MQRRTLLASLGVAAAAAAAAPEATYLRRLKAVTRSLRDVPELAAGRLLHFDDDGRSVVLDGPDGRRTLSISTVVGVVEPGDAVWVDTSGALWPESARSAPDGS